MHSGADFKERKKMENIVKAIYDNSSGTDYQYTVYTDDGKTLYINEKIIYLIRVLMKK